MLIRNVSYEIPSLKKQVQKLEQLQAESERKIKDCNKSEALAQKEFKAACDQLGKYFCVFFCCCFLCLEATLITPCLFIT